MTETRHKMIAEQLAPIFLSMPPDLAHPDWWMELGRRLDAALDAGEIEHGVWRLGKQDVLRALKPGLNKRLVNPTLTTT